MDIKASISRIFTRFVLITKVTQLEYLSKIRKMLFAVFLDSFVPL